MKILTMFSGREYILEDDEAEIVDVAFSKELPVRLRSGDLINTKGMESLGNPPIVPFYDGYPMFDGKSFMRDGERIYVCDWSNVEYKPDPHYEQKYKLLGQLEERKNFEPA